MRSLGLVFAQGALSFGIESTLISQVLYTAPGAPTLGGGFATAAFNVGSVLGPWLGGTVIGAGLGYRSPLWVSAVGQRRAGGSGLVAAGVADVAGGPAGPRYWGAAGRRSGASSSA